MMEFVGPIRGASFCFVEESWVGFRTQFAKSLDARKAHLHHQISRLLDGKSPSQNRPYAGQAGGYLPVIALLAWVRLLMGSAQASIPKHIARAVLTPTPAEWKEVSLDGAQVTLDLAKKTGLLMISKTKAAQKDGDCILLDAYLDALSAVQFNHASGGTFLFRGRKLIDVGWQKGRKQVDVREALKEPYRLIPVPSPSTSRG